MESTITIATVIEYKGSWLKILIPQSDETNSLAIIKTLDGEELKRVHLQQGSNAIDISNIKNQTISVKVETPFETILKQIKIND